METLALDDARDIAGPVCPEELPRVIMEPAEGALILYVCDDVHAAKTEVVPMLKEAGFNVEVVKTDMHNCRELVQQGCRVVVLDINCPDAAGYQICAEIRSLSQLPIMLVLRGSARTDVLHVFDSGADTYMVAPYNPREFLVRLSALLRRCPRRPWRNPLQTLPG
jgi:two-component system, OmpR family, alkaline phosphatase synthesis response regulator PhoP